MATPLDRHDSNRRSLRHRVAVAILGAGLALSVGCTGPTKKGIESRKFAQERFDTVRSRVDFDQANQAFESGNFIDAKRSLENAIDKYDAESSYWVLLGRIYLETHGIQDALASLNKAVEIDESNPDAHYFMGIVEERLERPLDAVDSYLTALELAPSNSNMLVAAIDVLIGADLLDEASRVIREHRADFEHDAAVLHVAGRVSMMKEDWTRAADDLEKSVLLDDSDRWTLEDLARAQIAAGRFQACLGTIGDLMELIDEGDRDVELMRLRGRCLSEAGRSMEARTAFRDLVNLHPEDVQGWIDLGLVCMEVEDHRYVLRAGQRLAVLSPNRFEGYFLLGHAALTKRDHDSAVKLFARACELAPERVEPRLALGMSHELRGDRAAAYRAYAKVAESGRVAPGMQGLMAGVGDFGDE
ncbi:MAG: tetratricopeptide repeat protein [Phycisphaera sp.]|nr:tetratricopeptide repeat protein [Phycisphaera sp.]